MSNFVYHTKRTQPYHVTGPFLDPASVGEHTVLLLLLLINALQGRLKIDAESAMGRCRVALSLPISGGCLLILDLGASSIFFVLCPTMQQPTPLPLEADERSLWPSTYLSSSAFLCLALLS